MCGGWPSEVSSVQAPMSLMDRFKKAPPAPKTVPTPGDDEEDTAEHDTGEHLAQLEHDLREEDWANWDADDAAEGWFRYFMIGAAAEQGEAMLRRRLNE